MTHTPASVRISGRAHPPQELHRLPKLQTSGIPSPTTQPLILLPGQLIQSPSLSHPTCPKFRRRPESVEIDTRSRRAPRTTSLRNSIPDDASPPRTCSAPTSLTGGTRPRSSQTSFRSRSCHWPKAWILQHLFQPQVAQLTRITLLQLPAGHQSDPVPATDHSTNPHHSVTPPVSHPDTGPSPPCLKQSPSPPNSLPATPPHCITSSQAEL